MRWLRKWEFDLVVVHGFVYPVLQTIPCHKLHSNALEKQFLFNVSREREFQTIRLLFLLSIFNLGRCGITSNYTERRNKFV